MSDCGQLLITYHLSLITFEEVEDRLVSEALLVALDGHDEDIERAHPLVFERVGALRDEDVRGASEEEREALHAVLLVLARLVALDLDQLQLDRPRRFGADAELRVQVLSE